MPFGLVAEGGMTLEAILRFLAFRDLPAMRPVSSDTEDHLAKGSVWLACARSAFPAFNFCIGDFKQPHQRQFIAFVSAMTRVLLADHPHTPMDSVASVHRLCKHVNNARQAAAAHRSLGGGRASYFVAGLRFPDEGVAAALDKEKASEMHFAGPVAVRDGLGEGALHFHFAFQSGAFYVACRDDDSPSASILKEGTFDTRSRRPGSQVSMGLNSVSPCLLMHNRGLPLAVNGPWVGSHGGVISLSHGKQAAAKALTQGVLCVFCIRDGVGKPQEQEVSPYAHYLNLDVQR